jgi:hypothetical protein
VELVVGAPRTDQVGPDAPVGAEQVVVQGDVIEPIGLDGLGERGEDVGRAADGGLRVRDT